MYKPESILENETHKILLDFKRQRDYLISARRPKLRLINKTNKKKKNTEKRITKEKEKRKRKKRELIVLRILLSRRPKTENKRKRKSKQTLEP